MLAPDGTWEIYDNFAIGHTLIEALTVDRMNRVWIATYGQLSLLTSDGSLESYPLPLYNVSALAIDLQNRVLVGTQFSLISFDISGEWKNYGINTTIDDLAIDNQNKIWIANGTSGGISRIDVEGNQTVYNDENWKWVFTIDVDPEGQVWFTGILNNYQEAFGTLTPDGDWITYSHENTRLSESDVQSLAFDKRGQLWIGQRGSITMIDPASLQGVAEASSNVTVLKWITAGVAWFLIALVVIASPKYLRSIRYGNQINNFITILAVFIIGGISSRLVESGYTINRSEYAMWLLPIGLSLFYLAVNKRKMLYVVIVAAILLFVLFLIAFGMSGCC